MPSRELEASDEQAALEALHAAGATDGLPVVIPIPERVERMIAGCGLDPDVALGEVGPGRGEATVEKVGINAVMAGCLPEHFPVVVAAVRAVTDPVFDLTEIQGTTHNLGPCMIVNGPARRLCGLASGFGALGPGHRANAAIGRALRLVLINLGGGRPGVTDMALLGQPGKFTSCLAEAEEDSPFPPLHTSLGYEPDRSSVTVVGVEGPHSVIASLDREDAASADRLLRVLAASIASVASNNAYAGRGSVVVLLNPDHAQTLAHFGYDRRRIQEALWERARNPLTTMLQLAPFLEVDLRARAVSGEVPALAGPEAVLVAVAGGTGLYSAVMPSWGAGPHGNTHVTRPIDLPPALEGPGRD